MVYLESYFEKVDFEKKSADNKRNLKIIQNAKSYFIMLVDSFMNLMALIKKMLNYLEILPCNPFRPK